MIIATCIKKTFKCGLAYNSGFSPLSSILCTEHGFDLNKVRQGKIIEIGSALTKLREGNILKWFDMVVC